MQPNEPFSIEFLASSLFIVTPPRDPISRGGGDRGVRLSGVAALTKHNRLLIPFSFKGHRRGSNDGHERERGRSAHSLAYICTYMRACKSCTHIILEGGRG